MEGLRKTRLNHRLSLSAISELTGVTPAAFNNIENGKTIAWLQTRQSIETFLGKVDWLDGSKVSNDPLPGDWDSCERDFRFLCRRIASLPEEQKQAFIRSARAHLKSL